jgi:FAD/FMN-containing dehydrogenase
MGALPGRGCTYGAYPRYVVNATTEEQIEQALMWAGKKNVRVVIKGTGHDLLGRSDEGCCYELERY